jgi:hypothetical protein
MENNKRCLDLGVRFCNIQAESYIDDLPSITTNLLKNLNGEQTKSFIEFFGEVKSAGYNRLLDDIELYLSKEKTFNRIVSETKPFSISKRHTVFNSEKIHGYVVELPYHRFTEYHIEKIGLYANNSGNVTLHVIDLVSNILIEKKDFSVTKGVNTIPVGIVFENEYHSELFIGIKSDVPLIEMRCEDLSDCCDCQYACDCVIDYGMIDSCGIFDYNTIEPLNTKYWCLQASVRCNFEAMICEYSEFFQSPFAYLVGTLILEHKINSYERGWYSDANNQLIIDKTLPDMVDRYQMLLSSSVEQIKGITNDSICWSCSNKSNRPQMSSFV